jgi:hypothetical protein
VKRRSLESRLVLIAVVCSFSLASIAQQTSAAGASTPANTTSAVPRVVNYGSRLTDLNGKPLTGVTGVTFLLYREPQGGVPLWLETQNVQPGKDGRYSVALGSTTSGGLPEDVFVSGEARWLAVQIQGQNEQSRVPLLAVPYALKSQDAETLGGLPASAFLLAAPPSNGASSPAPTSSDSSTVPRLAAITGSGTIGFLPAFTGATTVGNSAVFQKGVSPTAKIGINTATPAAGLDVVGTSTIRGVFTLPATSVATAVTGKNSQPENWVASAFNSGRSAAVTQTFQLKAEPVGNNTATASGSLNLLFGQGASAPAETGLRISSEGILTFVDGQTFPGTGPGTVSSIDSGAGLTGGPITTSGTLSIARRAVTNAMLQSPSLTVAAGADLTGGGSVTLGGTTTLNLDTTKVPLLSAANIFTGNQSVIGNLAASGQMQAGPAGLMLPDGIGQTMQIFSNPSTTGASSGTVQFIPDTGTLVGVEAYSVGLISGTFGDFYCHHGLAGGGAGVCYFADVANNAGHIANSFSQALQFDSVNSSGIDVFTSVRANPQNSLEVSSGGSPGTSFGTIRQVPTVFANLPTCGPPAEGTTATVSDSTANTWGATITGGGNNHVLAYCDGTDWTVAAK